MPFLSDQKNLRAPRPPPTLVIFPKSAYEKSEIAILFNIVEKPYNYVFGDDLLPHSPRGKGYKLRTLISAFISGDILVGGGVEKRGIWRGSFPSRNLLWGKKISMKGAQDFLALLKKKQWKNKSEKVFSNGSKEQHQNLKRT